MIHGGGRSGGAEPKAPEPELELLEPELERKGAPELFATFVFASLSVRVLKVFGWELTLVMVEPSNFL